MARFSLCVGALVALLAVAAGAFGAHALKGHLDPEMLGVFQIAVRYQMYHALALLAVGLLQTQWPANGWLRAAAGCFIGGITLFCGSLYLLSLAHASWLGIVTPLGGLALMAGWACLAMGSWKHRS